MGFNSGFKGLKVLH